VIDVRRAGPADVAAIHDLRVAAELWLADRGISQWTVGRLSRAAIGGQVAHGEWHVAGDAGPIAGAFRLLWSDPDVWPDHVRAVYVHALMTDRERPGEAVGAQMLDWAAQTGLRAGANALRLDCVAGNARLRRYYTDLGFRESGSSLAYAVEHVRMQKDLRREDR
jgi:GNAT superfamily N-acetyltransferase